MQAAEDFVAASARLLPSSMARIMVLAPQILAVYSLSPPTTGGDFTKVSARLCQPHGIGALREERGDRFSAASEPHHPRAARRVRGQPGQNGVREDARLADRADRARLRQAPSGLQIRQLVGDETVRFFVSPYLRARQTLLAILSAFDGQPRQVTSEPRLREQDFGNFQSPEGMETVFRERQEFGRFYYRFPNGEAGTDVFDRMASFLTYLFRSMNEKGYFETRQVKSTPNGPMWNGEDSPGDSAAATTWEADGSASSGGVECTTDESGQDYCTFADAIGGNDAAAGVTNKHAENFVLVTHGLLMRIFCMCYLRWTVTEFEQVWNPSNCEIWVLQKQEGKGTYELAGRWRASPYRGKFVEIKFGKGKKEPLFEHMKKPLVSRLVTPGAPDALDNDELAFLRDLPGPKPSDRSKRSKASNRAMLAGEAVKAYWAKDTKRAKTGPMIQRKSTATTITEAVEGEEEGEPEAADAPFNARWR